MILPFKPFYGVMCKYEKHFSEDGVRANLSRWYENKYGLRALLRNHPAWDEDAMAVILPLTENRSISRGEVDSRRAALFELDDTARITSGEREAFRAAVVAATGGYNSLLSEGAADTIKDRTAVKCVAGQKTTRVIGKLCQKYGVDQHSRYNAVFAQLSDSLNPMEVSKKALLSVHPCDFLEMSNKDNTWTSCHNLRDGGWQSGCLSYMNDSTSVMFYTVDGDVEGDYSKALKRNRQVFCYAEGMLLQSRLYPNSGDNDAIRRYRALVQEAVACCLGVPNKWVLRKNKDGAANMFLTAEGSRQYTDYTRFGTISTLKGLEAEGQIVIGGPAYCVCCGGQFRNGSVKCGCADKVVCQDCGRTVPASNARYTDGIWVCLNCLHICAGCNTAIRDGTLFPAYDRHGNIVHICEDCYQRSIAPCASCSVQALCPSVMSGRYCPKTAVGAAA